MREGRGEIVHAIEDGGVVAVVRLKDARVAIDVARALAAGGVNAIEITMTVPRAVALIEEIRTTLPPTVLVGAGTVLDAATARVVIRAGARFVVSPVFKPDMIDECHREGVPAIPGCFTPTEILAADESGADIVKIFPATSLGPSFIRDVHGPLPHVRLIPTGGVTRENAGAWIRAGAVAIGVGTALVHAADVASSRFDAITEKARRFVAEVRQAREGTLAAI